MNSIESRKRGFTLLEVLAAVALLGLMYTILGQVAIQGLGAEGESARRIEASLLADRVLSDLEIELAQGSVPPLGERDYEDGEWHVRVRVAAFEPPFASTASAEDGSRGGLPPGTGAGTTFPVRSIQVQVSWIEGAAERTVSRTTYALDLSGVEALAGQLEGPSS